jgi:putative FmdB family regulatory protein
MESRERTGLFQLIRFPFDIVGEIEPMPIYEFYCSDCHTVYSFLAKSASNTMTPGCPKCKRKKLEKQVSRFAISKGLTEQSADGDPFEGMDDAKMEAALESMSGDFENVNEDDPKQMASMMRRLFETTGMQPNGSIEEAMRRMEAGEDPDKVEEEMGDVLDSEDPFEQLGTKKAGMLRRLFEAPNVDPNLYDLE